MKNISRKLTALNADSIRHLINEVNERHIMKDDVLDLVYADDSFCLLYYEDRD